MRDVLLRLLDVQPGNPTMPRSGQPATPVDEAGQLCQRLQLVA
ncbi:MAG TPA: hypothetical protein VKI00_17465 [Mycobacterium sp.]|nr:hypothetical protein [Mycobacterium sp.]HME77363.1 hypothetical protein [Mycobacterium sp.]